MTARRLSSSGRRARAGGFTLVELLVALLLSLMISVALLKAQAKLGQQTVRTSDVSLRDTQSRAAMDLITRDLSGAGFLFGGTQTPCSALAAYNSAAPGGYSIRHPVDAAAASFNATMKFAPSLTLTYPPSGSTLPSDVLVIAASAGSANFNDATYPAVNVSPNPAYSPMTTGMVPMVAAAGLTAGNVGILQVPVNGKRACLRVPLTAVAGAVVSSAGALMPGAYYAGFGTQMTAMGMTDTLSNAEIFQSRLVDMGPTAAPAQTSTVFYVEWGAGGIPMLMRATYSLLDDTAIGAPQAIAAGVVSLQVRFGVDPGSTGAVTAYQTAADVTANKYWEFVRSVKVAIVTRTLSDDAEVSASTVALGAPFSSLPVVAQANRRYVVDQTEIATRNLLWNPLPK